MHRQILGLPLRDVRQSDHINGDRLDNRRANLRVVTNAQNSQNKTRLNSNNTSGHKGVYWNKARGKWQAYGKIDGRARYLGLYDDIETAAQVARAYRASHLPFSREAAA